MTHYARGIALAVTHRPLEARVELARLRAAASDVPASFVLHNNTCRDMLRIADAMLVGEIEYREGGDKLSANCCASQLLMTALSLSLSLSENYPSAFAKLREAVELSDGLVYDEPWGWMQPPRHALGALLLDQVIPLATTRSAFKAEVGLLQ
jgi:hypothetical protein